MNADNTEESRIDSGTAPAGPERLGDVLREAREAQNLSVADVARQLKLSVNQVEALESGEFARLPGVVFVRGFVRNYARLLNLDVNPLLDEVARRLPREEPRPAAPPSQNIPFPTAAPSRWPLFGLALAVIVLALVVYEFLRGGETGVVTHPVAATPAAGTPPPGPAGPAAPQPDLAAAVAPSPAGDEASPAALATGTGATAGPATEGSEPAAQASVVALSTAVAGPSADGRPGLREGPDATTSDERRIHLAFDRESWVEIRDAAGNRLFSGLNQPGTERSVTGRPPFAIVIGNAAGVRMTYGDRAVDLARYTKVNVARLTLE